MSVEEFLAWEREQPERHEFVAGEIFGMVGASLEDAAIELNHPACRLRVGELYAGIAGRR